MLSRFLKKNELVKSMGSINEINQREISIVQHNVVKGIMNVVVDEKRKKVNLIISTNNQISLETMLESTMDQVVFFKIVKGIVSIIINASEKMLKVDNFDLDFKNVFLDESTKDVSLVYWPTLKPHATNDIHHFFMMLLNQSKMTGGNEKDMLQVIEYLTQNKVFSIKNFAKVLSSIESGGNLELSTTGYVSGSLTANTKTVETVTEEVVNQKSFRYVPKQDSQPIKQVEQIHKEEVVDESATTVLSEATTVLSDSSQKFKPSVILRRIKNDQVYSVDLESNRIGKSADISIDANSAISRVHAEIYIDVGSYFVADLDSTNGTYVNGIKIQVPTELNSGDTIKFANEEFVFEVLENV